MAFNLNEHMIGHFNNHVKEWEFVDGIRKSTYHLEIYLLRNLSNYTVCVGRVGFLKDWWRNDKFVFTQYKLWTLKEHLKIHPDSDYIGSY